MSSSAKYYCVVSGFETGIYRSWEDTKKQTNHYKYPIYKSFKNRWDAEDWFKSGYKKDKQYLMYQSQGVDLQAYKDFVTQNPTKPDKFNKNKKEQTKPYDYKDYDVVVFSDGGNRITGNIKGQHINSNDPSAWAYELIYPDKTKESDSYGYLGKTNNAMEISGLINGLQTIIDSGYHHKKVLSVMDSKYVINSVTQKWIDGWKRDNWTRHGQPLKNAGLWKQLYVLLQQMDHLDIMWVKGHTDRTDFYSQGNQDVDTLLNKTMDNL